MTATPTTLALLATVTAMSKAVRYVSGSFDLD